MSQFKKLLYTFGQQLKGLNVSERLAQLTEMEHWEPERIYDFQLNHLKQLTQHVYQNVPFYKQLWDQAGVHPDQIKSLDDLSKFPKTSKQLLSNAGDNAIAFPERKTQYVQFRSSGSTGKPFTYYLTKEHHSWFLASNFQGLNWAGWEIGEPWIRLQWLGDLHGNLSLRDRIEFWAFNCLYMSIGTLSSEYVHDFVEKARQFKPVLLRGFTAAAFVFANYFLERNQQFPLRTVATTGDTLHPHFREAMETAFQCKVFDGYGGESMRVLNQCDQGAYHILPVVYVEVKPEGPETEDGQPCKLLLTSLTNYATPFIRYEIGDVGIMGEGSCSCGKTWKFLKKLVGRETDIVVTPAGHYIVCHHFNNMLKHYPGVEQFQVIQHEKAEILMKLVTNQAYTQQVEEAIKKRFEELGGEGFTVNIEHVSDIPMTRTGKRRYIISDILKTTEHYLEE